jgi:hypothetical protein
VLKNLAEQAPGMVEAFVGQLHALHERVGLQPLALKPVRRRKGAITGWTPALAEGDEVPPPAVADPGQEQATAPCQSLNSSMQNPSSVGQPTYWATALPPGS